MSARAERGAASSEVVLVTPVIVFLLVAAIQFALYQHARHMVTAAAQEGLATALTESGSASAARARADWSLERAGGGLLSGVAIRTTRGHDHARVTVDANVTSMLPGFRFRVRGTAQGVPERFRPRTEP